MKWHQNIIIGSKVTFILRNLTVRSVSCPDKNGGGGQCTAV